MEGIQWSSQQVLNAVDTHITRQNTYAQNCVDALEGLGDVAAVVARSDPAKAEELRQEVVRLLEARHSAQLHTAALQELKGSYQASGQTTDFQAALSGRAQQLEAQQPYNHQADPLYRDFQMAVNGGEDDGAGGGGGDEVIDDDIAIEGGANQLAPNATCPITTRPLLQIEDPVQDSQGVVYEREAVVAYFRRLEPARGGRAIIMAGSTHQVTLAELVPAERVIREKRRQARLQRLGAGGGAGTQQVAAEDVLDV